MEALDFIKVYNYPSVPISRLCEHYGFRLKCQKCGIRTCRVINDKPFKWSYFPIKKDIPICDYLQIPEENLIFAKKNWEGPTYCSKCFKSLNLDLEPLFFFGILDIEDYSGF